MGRISILDGWMLPNGIGVLRKEVLLHYLVFQLGQQGQFCGKLYEKI
jgi:hypothetical protein